MKLCHLQFVFTIFSVVSVYKVLVLFLVCGAGVLWKLFVSQISIFISGTKFGL